MAGDKLGSIATAGQLAQHNAMGAAAIANEVVERGILRQQRTTSRKFWMSRQVRFSAWPSVRIVFRRVLTLQHSSKGYSVTTDANII